MAPDINRVAASNQADPPMGSIMVKESYSTEDQARPNNQTVMKRIKGYDPDNGDWFWASFDAESDYIVFLND